MAARSNLLATEVAAMIELPPVIPRIGLSHRIWLARDYYVRVAGVDYSIDPRVIGRFLDVSASPTRVVARCDDQIVARHDGSWAKHTVVTDREHLSVAAQLRHGRTAPPTHRNGHTSAHRRVSRLVAGIARLRRSVRRRFRIHPDNNEDHIVTTVTKKKAAAAVSAPPADGVPSQISYLTRVLKTRRSGEYGKSSPITPATRTGHTRNTSQRYWAVYLSIVNRRARSCGSTRLTYRQ